MPEASDGAPFPTSVVLPKSASMFTCADLLFSPVFHKHPDLQVALSEGGIGWVPSLLERIDHVWERHHYYNDIVFDARPSDLFHRNMWGCFIDDVLGMEVRDHIGVDRITWEGDYPHADCNWPNSRQAAAEHFAHVPDEDVHMMAELNARRLFHFD